MKKTTLVSALLLQALTLVSCGGGGGGSSTSGIQGTGIVGIQGTGIDGIQGTGVAIGPVTGFGSVFVNGIEYFTTSAQIRIDGASGSESQLKIGQVVTIKGSVNSNNTTGTATEVTFLTSVQGSVTALNTTAGTFVVLGQTVRVSGTTVFDNSLSPASIDGLAVSGIAVQVSGFRNATGEIVATRIERAAAGADFEITGTVSALNTTALTFTLGSQTIDYSAATVSNGTLSNGATVEVKGSTVAGNALRPRSVEIQSALTPANNDGGKVQGIVTRFGSATDFDIGGTRVSTTGTTVFTNNGLALGLNIKAEVEGRFNASGVLVATKVELKPDSSIRLHATIDSIDTAANTVRVLGGNVAFNAATQIEDKSSLRVSPLRIGGLRTGDTIEARGYENSAGTAMIAVIFERLNADNKVEVESVARNPSDPNITVLGGTIALTGNIDFRDLSGSSVTRTQFFAAVAGKAVRLRGTISGGIVTWQRAEIRN